MCPLFGLQLVLSGIAPCSAALSGVYALQLPAAAVVESRCVFQLFLCSYSVVSVVNWEVICMMASPTWHLAEAPSSARLAGAVAIV